MDKSTTPAPAEIAELTPDLDGRAALQEPRRSRLSDVQFAELLDANQAAEQTAGAAAAAKRRLQGLLAVVADVHGVAPSEIQGVDDTTHELVIAP